MPTPLTESGQYIDADESSELTATLYDTQSSELSKLAIQSVTLTIVDEYGNVINDRNAQDILDANGGSLAEDGTLVVKMMPADNPFVNEVGTVEQHSIEVGWTWQDLQADIMTGKQVWTVNVQRLEVNG